MMYQVPVTAGQPPDAAMWAWMKCTKFLDSCDSGATSACCNGGLERALPMRQNGSPCMQTARAQLTASASISCADSIAVATRPALPVCARSRFAAAVQVQKLATKSAQHCVSKCSALRQNELQATCGRVPAQGRQTLPLLIRQSVGSKRQAERFHQGPVPIQELLPSPASAYNLWSIDLDQLFQRFSSSRRALPFVCESHRLPSNGAKVFKAEILLYLSIYDHCKVA